MDTLGLSTQYKVRHCSQCQGDTEYYCHTCKHDLCLQCKAKHTEEKHTKHHHTAFYITRHTNRTFNTQCKVHVRHCSQCMGDTQFYCNTCQHDLCLQCKERHVIDLHTKCHAVVIYRERFKYVPLREACVRHPNRKYRMFCDQCKYSVCTHCTEHRTHPMVDLKIAYQTKRQQHREIFDNIRSDTLYNCRVLLAGIQTDIQTYPPQICHRQSQMSTKAQRLKDLIDTVVCYSKTRYRGLLIARIQQQKRKMNRHLTHIHNYEDRYEQSANRAVQFLLFIKTSHVPQMKDTPNLPQHLLLSLTDGFNMEDVSQLLRGIPEIQMLTGKRQVGIDECVELTSTPILHSSVCVTGVSHVSHISRVISDSVWVFDGSVLILTDTKGGIIHRVTDGTAGYWYGTHTMNKFGELIYSDNSGEIKKLSSDNKTVTRLYKIPEPWEVNSIYSSPSTGDLIIGMGEFDTDTAVIVRYSSKGQHIQTIQHDNTGNALYIDPRYITENHNGDIVVSDWGRRAIVVTDRRGRHRFSYTGPTSGSLLLPQGICTDALSHILVCDSYSDTVQMIDKDGHFLSLLLTQQHGLNRPHSLSSDDKTHLLWVGSFENNTMYIYRHIQRRYSLTDNPDGDECVRKTSSSEEVQKPGKELEISEKFEENSEDQKSEENSEDLKSEENSGRK